MLSAHGQRSARTRASEGVLALEQHRGEWELVAEHRELPERADEADARPHRRGRLLELSERHLGCSVGGLRRTRPRTTTHDQPAATLPGRQLASRMAAVGAHLVYRVDEETALWADELRRSVAVREDVPACGSVGRACARREVVLCSGRAGSRHPTLG
jgi:hypothetical protein